MIHFQGICKYDMASPKQTYPGLPYFRVFAKMEERHDNNIVSYVRYMEIRVFGHVIILNRNKRVTVSANDFLKCRPLCYLALVVLVDVKKNVNCCYTERSYAFRDTQHPNLLPFVSVLYYYLYRCCTTTSIGVVLLLVSVLYYYLYRCCTTTSIGVVLLLVSVLYYLISVVPESNEDVLS